MTEAFLDVQSDCSCHMGGIYQYTSGDLNRSPSTSVAFIKLLSALVQKHLWNIHSQILTLYFKATRSVEVLTYHLGKWSLAISMGMSTLWNSRSLVHWPGRTAHL